MAYISNHLTHWAGRGMASDDDRYDLLINNILAKRELLFSSCPWEFCAKYGGVTNFSIPVICFTDIPFGEVERHCSRYSRFGVSLTKNYLTNCLASPVAYTLSPFVYEAYSGLLHSLWGIQSLVDGKILPEGKHQGTTCDIQKMLMWVQTLAIFYQNYDRQEYVYNEKRMHPRPDQDSYFERPEALYYEREWRLIERQGSQLPWDVYRDGKHFFRFEPAYVRFIVMPRTYVNRFAADASKCLKDYPSLQPSILAFEDLKYF
jgi:hypothetical protein